MSNGALQRFRAFGETLTKSGDEFVISIRIAPVAVPGLRYARGDAALQSFDNAASDFILHVEDIVQGGIMLPGVGDLFGFGFEQLERDPPARSHSLNVALQDVADAQIATRLARIAAGRVLQ